jgi:hypothetical protein
MAKRKSNNSSAILGLLFLILIVTCSLIILPNMFASTDNIADENNITTSEYAAQYQSGQDFIQMVLTILMVVDILLAVTLMIVVIKTVL